MSASIWHGPAERARIIEAVSAELDHAYAKHGQEQWGRHEFYAILKEEVDELWDAIKSDAHQNDVRAEAIDVMAMCIRYLETGDRYREPTHLKGKSALESEQRCDAPKAG